VAPPQARPVSARSAATTTPTIDPVKILKKYLWVLVAAAFLGAVLGVAGHFVLLTVAPKWRSTVIFECSPPIISIDIAVGAERRDEKELERFMETQRQRMIGNSLLDDVVDDPRLRTDAPNWSRQFGSGASFDRIDAIEDLKDLINARLLRNTVLIELSCTWKDKNDATAIVRIVKERYETILERESNKASYEQRDKLNDLINTGRKNIKNLQDRRNRILVDEGVDSLESNMTHASMMLLQITHDLATARLNIEAIKVQLNTLEEQLAAPGGITYSDSERSAVDQDRIVANLRAEISSIESIITAKRIAGLGDAHREMKQLRAQLDSRRQQLQVQNAEALRKLFDARVDSTRLALAQFLAQEADLLERKEEVRIKSNELTRIQLQIEDIHTDIDSLQETVAGRESSLAELTAQRGLETVDRIKVVQDARVPDTISFPKLIVIGPTGVILVTGLVGGLVVLREMLDQRVKGAADIAAIPRASVIGVIPDAAEDPSNPECVETVFRDSPKGVLAETFRQLRAPLLKRIHQGGHKVIMLTAGMPESGVSTITLNIAMACASTGERVLIIDANLRRPSIHRILGLPDRPGLGDVLAGQCSLEDAAVATGQDNLEVLPAGSPEHRVYEGLAGEAMNQLLAAAKQKYDIVFLDVAPAVVSGDAAVLANRVDASVLVTRALKEKRGMVARLAGELNDANSDFLGVIVNGVRSAAGGYLRRNIRATYEYQHGDEEKASA